MKRSFAWISLAVWLAPGVRPAAQARKGYTLEDDTYGKTLKAPDGRVVLGYMTVRPENTALSANSVACFHPLNTPSGERITDFAPPDHRHHRGVFLTFHALEFRTKANPPKNAPPGYPTRWNINRADFWGWGQFAPTDGRVIKNRDVKLVKSDAESAQFEIRNDWTANGKSLLAELTLASVTQRDNAYVLDLEFNLTPQQQVIIEKSPFGGLCFRGRNDGDVTYFSPAGKVDLPDPHYATAETDWPAADWYDYTITTRGGKTVGAAVMDHPSNPPSAWHNARNVWMMNPCPVAKGPMTVEAGTTLRLRYRIVVHDGATPNDLLARLAREWRGR